MDLPINFLLASTSAPAASHNLPFLYYMIGSAVTFLVLWVILGRVFFKPMLKVLEERDARTKGDESAAKTLREESKRIFHYIEGELKAARLHGVTTRDQIVFRAKAEANKIIEEAQEQAANEVQAARLEIARLKEGARQELQTEAEKLALEAYKRLLNEDRSPTIH